MSSEQVQFWTLTNAINTNKENTDLLEGLELAVGYLSESNIENSYNIGVLQGDVSTLSGEIFTITGQITELQNTTATNTSNISTLTTNLGTSADIGTTTAWGQANLSRSINRLSTVLRSSANIPTSYTTIYGEVLLPLLDTGNTQERTLGFANFTVENNTNSTQNITIKIIVSGIVTEIVTSVPAGIGHATTIPIAGASVSVVTSGQIPIRLQAFTPNAGSLTPKFIQIWGIGQLY